MKPRIFDHYIACYNLIESRRFLKLSLDADEAAELALRTIAGA